MAWAVAALCLSVCCANIFTAQAATSPPPLILENGRPRYDMGGHLEVFPDRTGQLTIKDVVRPTTGALFMNPGPGIPNLGVLAVPLWVRFSLRNPSDLPQKLLLFPLNIPWSTSCPSMFPEPGGHFKEITAGDSVPQSPEVVPDRYFLMPFVVPPNTEQTFYLQVQANVAMTLPMTLWADRAFHSRHQKLQVLFGIIFGASIGFYDLFSGHVHQAA